MLNYRLSSIWRHVHMIIPFKQALIDQVTLMACEEEDITPQEGGISEVPGIVVLAPYANSSEEREEQINRFWDLVLTRSSLGFGEAYMEGLWTTHDLSDLICRILKANLHKRIPWNPLLSARNLKVKLSFDFSFTTKEKSKEMAAHHYDQQTAIIEAMLGEYQVYSCGRWKSAQSIEEAQKAKIDLIARKLRVPDYPDPQAPRVLDIGCGYGDALRHMAEKYGIRGTGLTLSEEQAARAREKTAGHDIEILCMDYRDLTDREFDAIYSIGMFEHVGQDQHVTYLRKVQELLAPHGISVLHTILSRDKYISFEPWFMSYIFPHSYVPTDCEITEALEATPQLYKKHTQFFGQDYAQTLEAWYQRFTNQWHNRLRHYFPFKAKARTFYLMWEYYLRAAKAGFLVGNLELGQYVMTKDRALLYEAPAEEAHLASHSI